MESDGQEAHQTGDGKRQNNRYLNIDAEAVKHPIRDSAQHSSYRVYLFAENYRFVVQQDVSDDTTSSPCNTAHNDCHPVRLSECQRFLYACNRKECQSQRVEHKPRISEAFHVFGENHDKNQRQCRTNHIERIGHPEWYGSKHHIANRTPANSNGNATDISAKPVEMLGCRMSDSGNGKGKRAQELNNLRNNIVIFHIISYSSNLFPQ